MATREENLKKINDELEQLSNEELDKVAGGSWLGLAATNQEIPDDEPILTIPIRPKPSG